MILRRRRARAIADFARPPSRTAGTTAPLQRQDSALRESQVDQQTRQPEFGTLRGYWRQFVSGVSFPAGGGERFDVEHLHLQRREGSALAIDCSYQIGGPSACLLVVVRRIARG